MEVKDIIKKRRKEKHMTMKQLAEKVQVSEGTISRWESGEISNMRRDKVPALAKALDIPIEIIMEWETIEKKEPVDLVRIPIYGTVSAGTGCFADENIESYVEIPVQKQNGEYFGLRIRGDSMEPDIRDEDIVIVRKTEDVPETGKTVVAIVNGDEGFCKKLAKYNDGIALVSNNTNYMPMYFSAEQIQSLPVRIVGVVERLIRDF